MSSLIDLHLHSTASDGTDLPQKIPERARAAGIQILALTDHDTLSGVEELNRMAPTGISFIRGIEFSCWIPSGKCHILGYGCEPGNPLFRDALAQSAALRQGKFEARLAFLRERGIDLPSEEVERLRQLPSVGKPHLANLMVRCGYAKNKEDAIQNSINLCHTESSRIPAETAVRAIAAAGGIPVWAHPLGGEGEKEIGKGQFEAMLQELLSYGLQGLECWYSKYSIERCNSLAQIAEARRLLISGGSDYHGTNKKIQLGTLNAEGQTVSSDRLTIVDAFQERGMMT